MKEIAILKFPVRYQAATLTHALKSSLWFFTKIKNSYRFGSRAGSTCSLRLMNHDSDVYHSAQFSKSSSIE